jgi:DNA-binding Xre family transcriptional regulator
MSKQNQERGVPMAVRLRLGDILKERNMTQTQFAELSGLSRNSVSTLVHQPAQIRFETIDILCATLGVSMDELFERVRVEPYK